MENRHLFNCTNRRVSYVDPPFHMIPGDFKGIVLTNNYINQINNCTGVGLERAKSGIHITVKFRKGECILPAFNETHTHTHTQQAQNAIKSIKIKEKNEPTGSLW